jgi:hypothetical protein
MQHDKHAWIPHLRYQVGLELVQVNVEAAIESERSSNTGDDLRDDSVEVGEARRLDVEIPLANVVNRLIIDLGHRSIGLSKWLGGQPTCRMHTINEQSTCSRVV